MDMKNQGHEENADILSRTIAQAHSVAARSNVPTSDSASHSHHLPLGSEGMSDTITIGNADTRKSTMMGPSKFLDETPTEEPPPPAYSKVYGQVDISQDGFDSRAIVGSDGRVNININQKSLKLSNLLVPALRNQLNLQQVDEPVAPPPGYIPPSLGGLRGQISPPPLNVVIQVVGSRGDVQPFVSLGRVLKTTYGHRVRLATHSAFRDFVEENGLEFFSIGGDPAELMAFMVKNPGLMPGMDALRNGDVGKRRKGMYEIIKGCWRSCFEAGDGTGIEVSDDQIHRCSSFDSGISVSGDLDIAPFVANAIIANPPSFAHVHCAEKLGIPLHLMFTMPWSPTQAFPHPLANIQSSNADANMTNFISYALVEMMTWQGLGDIINRFREKRLGLEPISLIRAPGMASRLRIPYTYCWSPSLIPKPKDWGPHISVSGFYFLSLADNYRPPQDLVAFLDSGSPPVYIGFGSIVVDDPNAMTKLIFDAVKRTGQRALVSKGWGGFGADALSIPEGVFMLGNVPHDWLFKHVCCVVHHGGAGTTAAGIALGKPTVVVPFFGDQAFWGAMVAKAGAGPPPIQNKLLTSENLASAILEALKPTALQRAQELGAKISLEKGSDIGAKNFHDHLGVDTLRCSLAASRAAVWQVKKTELRLSAFAAAVLGNEGLLDFNELILYRPREYEIEDGPWDPITGATSALMGTIGSLMMGVADVPIEIFRAMQGRSSGDTKTERDSKTAEESGIPPALPASIHSSSNAGSVADGVQSDTKASARPSVLDRNDPSITNNQARISLSRTSESIQQPSDSPVSNLPSNRSSGTKSPSQTSPQPLTDQPTRQISLETALGAGRGVGRIVGAGLKSPMDFTLGLARGFHNAPKLYGDSSVRKTDKITDLQSGLKVAGKEFGFGLYDGISGLVTQPLEGAKKEGVAGLLKGFGKGIGGVVFKPSAAFWSLPGYTFKGIYKELQKHLGSSVHNYIIAAHTAQGYDDWRASNEAERIDVVSRWHAAQVEFVKDKKSHQRRSRSPQGFKKTRYMTFDERKQYAEQRKEPKENQCTEIRPISSSLEGDNARRDLPDISPGGAVFEEAIQNSVAATSRGNPTEDAMIERAIRASVAELQIASKECDDDAVHRAIQASVIEASRTPQGQDASDEHREQLAAALRMSMDDSQNPKAKPENIIGYQEDDSGIDTDDDANVKAALQESKKHFDSLPTREDTDLQKALEQSRRHHDDGGREKYEEEVILDYVKRQSIAEAHHKRRISSNIQGASSDDNEHDQDLLKAIQESRKAHEKTNERF